MIRERTLGILVGATLLLAACGGGSPTAAPGQSTVSQTSAAETTQGETTTGETTAAETTETTSGGGGGNADACALLTVDEVAGVTEFGNITTQPVHDGDTDALSACGFMSEGAFPAAILSILDPQNTSTDISGYLALPGSEEIPVSGAKAVFVPASGNMLFVIKGDKVAGVLITPQQGEAIDAAKAVVQKVADRL